MDSGTPPNTETLTLAGLAAANGPWLAARLRRLGEMSGLGLPPPVVDAAVEQCSLVLRRIVKSEGRPAFATDMDSDPATELGRQQAQVHMRAGLDLPGSLRVLRLMRRCFDDLIRESWIDDKGSRARAHEDVERIFERTLLGLYVAWADPSRCAPSASPAPSAPAPDQGQAAAEALRERGRLAGLLAQREAELRRTLEAAHKAAALLKQERARVQSLEGELTQARDAAKGSGLEAGQARERVAGLEAELLQLRDAVTQARVEAQAALAKARASVQAHARGLAQAQEQAKRLQERQGGLAEENARLSAQVRALSLELEGLRAGTARDEQAEALRTELGQARADAARLGVERDAALERVAGLEGVEAALSVQAREHAARLEEAEGRARALLGERNALAQEVEALRASREQLTAGLAKAETARELAERNAAELARRMEQAAQDAEAGLASHMAALKAGAARTRENGPLGLAAYLEISCEALAAVDGAGRFEVWNEAFPALFGLAGGDLAHGLDAVLPRMAATLRAPEPFLARMRGLLAGNGSDGPALALETSAGRCLRLRTRALRDAQGHPRGGVIALCDVSLECEASALLGELEAATRLEPDRPSAEFLRLSKELLALGTLPPELAARLAQACGCGWHVLGAVRLAADVFGLEHGLLRSEPGRTLDLAEAARGAVRLAEPLAAGRGIALALTLDKPSLPPGAPLPADAVLRASGDPRLAGELVSHLLRDALDAAPQGGEVELALAEGGSGPSLSVTRPGELPKKARAGFFAKPAPGGESLAAAAVVGHQQARYAARLLAEALGGTLAVASAHGRGTTVILTLPGV